MVNIIGTLISNTWDLLTTVYFPGTSIPIASIMLGAVCCVFSIKLLSALMNIPLFGSQRGGNNKNIHISDNRKNDKN